LHGSATLAPLAASLAHESRQVDAVGLENVGQLVLGMYGNEGGDQGAGGGAGDDARQETAQEEGLDDAKVAEAEYGAALEDKGGAAECLPCVVYEVELHLVRQASTAGAFVDPIGEAGGQGADVLDTLSDLGDVLVDEVLCAGEGAVVELGGGDVAEVADEAGA